jgi:hypothetical protein
MDNILFSTLDIEEIEAFFFVHLQTGNASE